MQTYMYYCYECNTLGSAEADKLKCPKCKEYMKPLELDIEQWRSMTEDARKQAIEKAYYENSNIKDEINIDESDDTENLGTDKFSNIDKKIKSIAKLILYLSIILGSITIGKHLFNYLDYSILADEHSSINDTQALIAKTYLISALKYTFIGVISSFLIYGFGEIIFRLIQIDDKISKMIK